MNLNNLLFHSNPVQSDLLESDRATYWAVPIHAALKQLVTTHTSSQKKKISARSKSVSTKVGAVKHVSLSIDVIILLNNINA